MKQPRVLGILRLHQMRDKLDAEGVLSEEETDLGNKLERRMNEHADRVNEHVLQRTPANSSKVRRFKHRKDRVRPVEGQERKRHQWNL